MTDDPYSRWRTSQASGISSFIPQVTVQIDYPVGSPDTPTLSMENLSCFQISNYHALSVTSLVA